MTNNKTKKGKIKDKFIFYLGLLFILILLEFGFVMFIYSGYTNLIVFASINVICVLIVFFKVMLLDDELKHYNDYTITKIV